MGSGTISSIPLASCKCYLLTLPYGQTLPFGSGSTLFTPGGLQNGEIIGTVTLAVSGNGGAATAPVSGSAYTITPSAAAGGTFTPVNYAITYITNALTVNPAALTVTANAQSKTYGQTLLFGSGSTLFTSGGLQNGEMIGTVTLAVSGNGGAVTAPVSGSPYDYAQRGNRRHLHAGQLRDHLHHQCSDRQSGGPHGDRQPPEQDIRTNNDP